MRGRKGARQLAVTNAGTIPDRGLYGVHLPDGRRVGELDEEMVYEARPGQTFLLGATTWRIQDITRDRVIVIPAPGVPGAVPFWRGDGVGRPSELGRAIGAFAREAVGKDAETLAAEYDLDPRAAENLVTYLREQQAATRVVPSDETIVVEKFRDEIGDWRLCVLSPFGGRVHAAWGLALSARIRDELDLEADAIWSDDGIVIHLPDADEPPDADLVLLEPDEIEDLVVRELGGSALFGARFRENAARSLLIPRAYPGKRTPLWQQRLKSQSLLEVAKDFPRFPVILETYRECLRDVLDLPVAGRPAARPALAQDHPGRGRDADRLAVRLVAALRLRRHLHVRGRHAERRAPRGGARARPRPALRAARRRRAARADRPRGARGGRALAAAPAPRRARQGPRRAPAGPAPARRPDRRRARGAHGRGLLGRLDAAASSSASAARSRSGSPARSAGSPPRTRGSTATRSACRRRAACPTSYPRGRSPTRWLALVRRYARTHGPFPTAQITRRFGLDLTPGAARARARRRARPRRAAPGRHRARVVRRRRPAPGPPRQRRRAAPGGRGGRPGRARPLPAGLAERRRPPARRRRPRPPARGAGPAPGRRADARGLGARRAAAPARRLQPDLARPADDQRRDRLDRRRPAGAHRPRGALLPRGRPPRRPAALEREARPARGRGPRRDPRAARRRRPSFWLDLVAELELEREELHAALWDLAWAGEVTNDAFAPLRARRLTAVAAATAAARRFASRRNPAQEAIVGRWSLTEALFRNAPAEGPRLRAQAELMLERYGIVTRETVLAEGVPGGFSSLYGELSNLEMLGTARRGYFVEGLGGAQFALAGRGRAPARPAARARTST